MVSEWLYDIRQSLYDENIDWEWLKKILTRTEVPEVFRVAFEIPDLSKEIFSDDDV